MTMTATPTHVLVESEVGLIPSDWTCTSVGDIAQVKGGKRLGAGHSLISEPTPHPYIRVTDMYMGGVALEDIHFVPIHAAVQIKNYRIFSDDIFISVAGTLGIVGRIPSSLDGANLTENADRITGIKCDVDYLKYWLSSAAIQNEIDSIRTVGAQPKLALGRIKDFKLPLPPTRAEQEKIVDALSDSDSLISSLQRLIAKKQAIKQGIMQQLLTRKSRLPRFEGLWDTRSIGEIVQSPVTDGPHMTPQFLTSGIPFLSVNNLIDGKISFADLRYISRSDHVEFSKKCAPLRNDILLGKAASVGKVALVETDQEFNIWSPIAMIRLAKGNYPKFVYYQLQSLSVVNQISLLTNTSSQGNIGMGDIEKIQILLPSYDEQVAISNVLSDVDAEIELLKVRQAKAVHIKVGMMQELLSGRTRLQPAVLTA